jgi:ribosomal protein L31
LPRNERKVFYHDDKCQSDIQTESTGSTSKEITKTTSTRRRDGDRQKDTEPVSARYVQIDVNLEC